MSNSTTVVKDSVEGLPKQFVSSLKILFDILDETRSGYIRFRDIESRWSDDGIRGLPPGVIDGLRKVTPPSGLLSFERFVAGLKLVLTKKREDGDTRRSFVSKENRTPLQEFNVGDRTNPREVHGNKFGGDARHGDKYSQREFDNLNQLRSQRPHSQYQSNSNIMKPSHASEHRSHRDQYYDGQNHRDDHKSPPVQPSKSGPIPRGNSQSSYVIKPEVSNYPNNAGSYNLPANSAGMFRQGAGSNQVSQEKDRAPTIPPRPERPVTSYSSHMKKSLSGPNLTSQSPPTVPPRGHHQSAWVLSDLKNWQREWTVKQNVDTKYSREKIPHSSRNSNQDNDIYVNIDQFQRRSEADLKQPPQGPHKATVQRHGSGRRHTLANGIDQNMMKRMKQLEEEVSMLRSGLAMVESAKDWYMKQLSVVSDKQAMLGKVTYNDNSVEAHQERMNFQKARIAEINQHLQTLLESSEKGFPIHMNLEVSAPSGKPADNLTIQRLREQNRQLREEMGQKKEHISQLEMEKASLVRDLFEVRSKNSSNHDDTTFM